MTKPLEPVKGSVSANLQPEEPVDLSSRVKKSAIEVLQSQEVGVKVSEDIVPERVSPIHMPSFETKMQIILNTQAYGGLGDIMAAVNMSEEIIRLSLEAEIVIVLTGSDRDKASGKYEEQLRFLKEIVEKLGIANSSRIKIVQPEKLETILKPDVPKIAFGVAVISRERKPSWIPKEIPFISLAEYGHGTRGGGTFDYSMGIGEDEIGVFISKELRDFAARSLSDEEKIDLLDPDVKVSLKADDSYFATHKLYFGYSAIAGSQAKFIQIICDFETNTSGDVDIVLVGMPFVQMLVDKRSDFAVKECIRILGLATKDSRFGTIEIIYDDKTLLSFQDPSKQGTLRLFFKKQLSHESFLSCLKISEKLTMLTGDQSCVEGIVLGKTVVYETLPHKVPFIQALIKFANDNDCPLLRQFFEEMSFSVVKLPLNISRFADQKVRLEREAQEFSNAIATKKDITVFLRSQLQALLSKG